MKSTSTSGWQVVRIWAKSEERGTVPEPSGKDSCSSGTCSSTAPTTCVSGSWHRALTTSRPILPNAPFTTTLIGFMAYPGNVAYPDKDAGVSEPHVVF
ncbi:hypothetical protein ES703_66324 [subsurface metagenome]